MRNALAKGSPSAWPMLLGRPAKRAENPRVYEFLTGEMSKNPNVYAGPYGFTGPTTQMPPLPFGSLIRF
jgi:hypothetical protein